MKKKTQKIKSIKLNYIYNVSYQILTLITPLITAPYLSRVLKADGIGAYSYTYSLVSYFIMFAALGTVNYGNREISYLQEDRAKRTKILLGDRASIRHQCDCVSLRIYGIHTCNLGTHHSKSTCY